MLNRTSRLFNVAAALTAALGPAVFVSACSGSDPSGTSSPSSASTPSAAAPAARAAAPSARPTWATDARYEGELEAETSLSFQVHLRLRNEDAAEAELAQISNPDSPRYGQFLSDEEFDKKYGPTDADVAAVRDKCIAAASKLGATLRGA